MPEYGTQVAPRDRWCIAAYIRALQLSQNATSADVPTGQKFRQLHRSSAISATEPRFRRLRFRPPQPQKGSLNDHGHRQDDEVDLMAPLVAQTIQQRSLVIGAIGAIASSPALFSLPTAFIPRT